MVDDPFGPAVPSVPLPNSPLSLVVAQIRFPVVASIADHAFVGPFQERIRNLYSDLRREEELQVEIGPTGIQTQQPGIVWRFTDEDNWEVALAPEFLALATNSYTGRADFLDRLGFLLEALGAWINPRKVRRLGVRYIDRVGEEHIDSIGQLVRPEVLGPMTVSDPSGVRLQHSLTDCHYQFSDETAMRARWGFLPPKATFDPAIDPIESSSWILDLDVSHGERPFDPIAIQGQVQLFSDRIYRYFRWATTDQFIATFGAKS
ncbi:TIGR04255 family protein [Candidatus Poriferisocius sp.]|uniref:TIGR04255 family protein n=1 Tax=Candidatus Poriferisocius sp. TaxID=3101276 RepID=UPI003B01B93F